MRDSREKAGCESKFFSALDDRRRTRGPSGLRQQRLEGSLEMGAEVPRNSRWPRPPHAGEKENEELAPVKVTAEAIIWEAISRCSVSVTPGHRTGRLLGFRAQI